MSAQQGAGKDVFDDFYETNEFGNNNAEQPDVDESHVLYSYGVDDSLPEEAVDGETAEPSDETIMMGQTAELDSIAPSYGLEDEANGIAGNEQEPSNYEAYFGRKSKLTPQILEEALMTAEFEDKAWYKRHPMLAKLIVPGYARSQLHTVTYLPRPPECEELENTIFSKNMRREQALRRQKELEAAAAAAAAAAASSGTTPSERRSRETLGYHSSAHDLTEQKRTDDVSPESSPDNAYRDFQEYMDGEEESPQGHDDDYALEDDDSGGADHDQDDETGQYQSDPHNVEYPPEEQPLQQEPEPVYPEYNNYAASQNQRNQAALEKERRQQKARERYKAQLHELNEKLAQQMDEASVPPHRWPQERLPAIKQEALRLITQETRKLPVAMSEAEIDQCIAIQYVPNKGRCAFARWPYAPGDIIAVERPLHVVTSKTDRRLWTLLESLYKDRQLEYPPIWHVAAITSVRDLTDKQLKALLDKYTPAAPPSADVFHMLKVHPELRRFLDPHLYERVLTIWKFNAFGHPHESEGLVIYDKVSMCAHDCGSSCTWHYGENDTFMLRARRRIKPGEEITISYIGDEELLRDRNYRQTKLAGWQFYCKCRRCTLPYDTSRGFKCPSCLCGTFFLTSECNPLDPDDPGDLRASPCTYCWTTPSAVLASDFLARETSFIEKIEIFKHLEVGQLEVIFAEALRLFTLHWAMFVIEGLLVTAYKEQGRYDEALEHVQRRINYLQKVLPFATYTGAYLHEEKGDLTKVKVGDRLRNYPHWKTLVAHSYEIAVYYTHQLSGWAHAYESSAYAKLFEINPRGAATPGSDVELPIVAEKVNRARGYA